MVGYPSNAARAPAQPFGGLKTPPGGSRGPGVGWKLPANDDFVLAAEEGYQATKFARFSRLVGELAIPLFVLDAAIETDKYNRRRLGANYPGLQPEYWPQAGTDPIYDPVGNGWTQTSACYDESGTVLGGSIGGGCAEGGFWYGEPGMGIQIGPFVDTYNFFTPGTDATALGAGFWLGHWGANYQKVVPHGSPAPSPFTAGRPGSVIILDPGAGEYTLGNVEHGYDAPGADASVSATDAPAPRAPPSRRNEQERKARVNTSFGNLLVWVHGLAHGTTEALDALDAIWKALPKNKRTSGKCGQPGVARNWGPRTHNKAACYVTPQRKAQDLVDNWKSVDLQEALKNLALNEALDQIAGRAYGNAARWGRERDINWGFTL